MRANRLGLPDFVVGALLLVSGPVFAHHNGTTLYDLSKQVTLKATITEFVWASPHIEIGFDAVDDRGTVRRWLLESNSPPVNVNRGWNKRTLKAGDVVTITFNPGRKGYIGRLVKVVMADGKEMK